MNVRLDSLENRRENRYRHPHSCIIVLIIIIIISIDKRREL
jgi:hypothetical protein